LGKRKAGPNERPGFLKTQDFRLTGHPPFSLFGLNLAALGWLAALLVTAGAECESCCCESDNCCDLGDGHDIFRLLSLLVAVD
jgi:hypothetical protein